MLYYPPTLPQTAENELYLALAQVQQGSNLTAGIGRLETAIEKHRPSRPEFSYELARAYSRIGDMTQTSVGRRSAAPRPELHPRAQRAGGGGDREGHLGAAAEELEKAVRLRPDDGNAFADLGSVYLRQNRVTMRKKSWEGARARPGGATRPNTMGLAALRRGTPNVAETHFREAIRLQPDLAEAHNNLGNLLAGRRAYAEAAHHFEKRALTNRTMWRRVTVTAWFSPSCSRMRGLWRNSKR